MKRHLTPRFLVFATFTLLTALLLATTACQKAPQEASTTSTTSAPGATTPQAPPAAAPATPPPPPTPKVQVCKLLSAAEVSAVMGKTLLQDGCSFGLDPTEKEKALAKSQDDFSKATHRAAAGDMNGFMKGMMQAGAGQQKTGNAMMQQLEVSVDASRDDQTEDAVKAIYAKTGAVVRGTLAGPLAPENHGMTGVIQGLDEVSNVGDWAFATNVASVNMGLGFSIGGRILEARKGPWHVTVSATISPDPGAAALDGQLAGVARALIAKL
jgi:hypothetical protein